MKMIENVSASLERTTARHKAKDNGAMPTYPNPFRRVYMFIIKIDRSAHKNNPILRYKSYKHIMQYEYV